MASRFPVAIDDDSNGYAVSSAYGLTNVPTAFLIAPSGEIEVSCVGWSKRDVEAINERLAQYRQSEARAHLARRRERAGVPRRLKLQELICGSQIEKPSATD